jgi:c-di-GMP-binding flagellar brake protein YcgR
MSYGKYFAKNQKVFLRRLFMNEEPSVLDTITGYAANSQAMSLDLALPYGKDAADSYPFEPGMKFEITSDSMGMGLRLESSFAKKINSRTVRLSLDGKLEFIARRIYPRVDVNAWVGLKQGKGNLAEMRTKWTEHLAKIRSGVSAAELTEFKKYFVNLSGGGMRLQVDTSAEMADLVLIYLSIGDKKGIICALAEVIWAEEPQDNKRQQVGLRFLNILEEDQERINQVVKMLLDQYGKTGTEGDD